MYGKRIKMHRDGRKTEINLSLWLGCREEVGSLTGLSSQLNNQADQRGAAAAVAAAKHL